jgi:hypothetical protein
LHRYFLPRNKNREPIFRPNSWQIGSVSRVIERSVVFGVLERFDLLFGDSGTVVERGILPYQVLKTDISEFLF